MSPDEVIAALGLQPHPEGGMYAETWRAPDGPAGRGYGTAIYFLLRAGEVSRWHRVDAAEMYHYYAGDPLEVRLSDGHTPATTHVVGPDVTAGARPQLVIPQAAWQSARSLGAWTLIGCTVSPGFVFEGFEMAPEGWEPGSGGGYTS